MKPNTEKSGRFRSTGAEILTRNAPASVESFLKDSVKPSKGEPQTIKPAHPQFHNSSIVDPESPPQLGRLHIEVRLELVQQLMQHVYQRKCDLQLKGRATQRAVIEEALEEYFRRHPK